MTFTDVGSEKLLEDNIFELLGIADANEEQKNKMMADITRTIQNRVVARILDGLKDEEVPIFEDAMGKDDEAVKQFLASKGIDLPRIATEEALSYKAELLAMVEIAGQQDKID